VNRTFKHERQKIIQIFITWKPLSGPWRNFYRSCARRMELSGWLQQIQDSDDCHLNFRKKYQQLQTGYIYLHQITWEDASRACGDEMTTWTKVETGFNHVTSPNEGLKHICVDLSDYKKHIFQPNLVQKHKYHTINTPEW